MHRKKYLPEQSAGNIKPQLPPNAKLGGANNNTIPEGGDKTAILRCKSPCNHSSTQMQRYMSLLQCQMELYRPYIGAMLGTIGLITQTCANLILDFAP